MSSILALLPKAMLSVILLLLLAACRPESSAPVMQAAAAEAAVVSPTATFTPTASPAPTLSPTLPATPLPTDTPAPTLTPTPSPSPTPDPTQPTVVVIEGIKGVVATGTFFPGTGPKPWPGIILLHMAGDDRHVWEENGFAELLVENGYAVLTVDIRSHGDSGGDSSWVNGEIDIRRWWNYFSRREDVDASRTALVGGSIGANLALFTGAAKTEVRTVVLLSPGLIYNSAPMEETAVAYGERPLLIVASEDDPWPSVEAAQTLAALVPGDAQVQLYETAGHGTHMLLAEEKLAGLIVAWLDTYVK